MPQDFRVSESARYLWPVCWWGAEVACLDLLTDWQAWAAVAPVAVTSSRRAIWAA
jgi:hypothetical protein